MKHLLRGLFLGLFFSKSAIALAFSWQDLWHTPDQQGQHLMEKGQYKKAQKTFNRRDWSATAAYRASDYSGAAQKFMELNTESGYYNAGNAYAHQGQYEKAVQAYSKALAINPHNADAEYNKQLVQQLLQNQKNQPQKQNQDQDQKQQNKDKDQQQNQDNQQDQNQQPQNQDQQNQQQGQDNQKKQETKPQEQQEQQPEQEQQQQKQGKDADQAKQAQDQAKQEKQHAQEQWLQLVPDDPGGLLREKFLRDYLRRQQEWQ